MITWGEYKKRTEKYWLGKKVVTLQKLENGNIVIPAGTILVIHRKFNGFTLKGVEFCSHCGIGTKMNIGRVPPTVLELKE